MLRWHLGNNRQFALPDASLSTRIGRDGARWAVLSATGNNVIHVRRRELRRQPRMLADSSGGDERNNVVPFISSYLRRVRAG